ncbi:MAG: hypothetical protein NC302_00380, partial [Bacteroidales bacterium]|nr:hypothetical protein [Bacteroidales bacterium]
MRDRELKAYLRTVLRQGEEPQAEKKAETVTFCLEALRQYGDCKAEERTGFWQFLSSVFRFEGLLIFGIQAGVLFVVCLLLGTAEDIVRSFSAFTPLFALAVMPALFRSRYYNMGELEAATRASGAEILLAKLLLAGAANLLCI